MNKRIFLFSLIFFTIPTYSSETEEDVIGNVTRTITSMGCHLNDATCYINVDQAVGLAGTCKGRSVRWKKDAVNGKEILSMFLAAQLANKQISISIRNECFNGTSNYPTFGYMNIIN